MAIAPISSISTRNNYIGFSGSKSNKKGNNTSQNTGINKAIPLATLLAMSPLLVPNVSSSNKVEAFKPNISLSIDASEQTGKVINSKEFVSPNGTKRVVKFISNDNNNQNFEKVMITESWAAKNNMTAQAAYELKSISKFNFNIQGDDGVATSPMTFLRLIAVSENNKPRKIADKDFCIFVANELASTRNNSQIEETNYKRNLRPTFDNDYSLQNVPNKNILKDSKGMDMSDPVYKKKGSQPFEGDNGNYVFTYYSVGDADKCQVVTVKGVTKDGQAFPEMKVMANISNNANFDDFQNGEDTPQCFNYGHTVLVDSEMNKYNISDKSLAFALMAIADNESFSSPYVVKGMTNRYMVLGKGTISHIDESEEADF